MPRYAWNKVSPEVKRRYFELIRSGFLPAKSIAARIGKSYKTVYREIARNSKP